ncbi:NXPE family member 3-like [Antedon mediterranea]|uniref:NXPE family member 3-like n=1 Tax=Antedon mediterranea TaxID=105859 RepID=UPI003AF974A4
MVLPQHSCCTHFRRRNVFVCLLFTSVILTSLMCSLLRLSPVDNMFRTLSLKILTEHVIPFDNSHNFVALPYRPTQGLFPENDMYIPRYTEPPRAIFTDAGRSSFYIENEKASYNICDKIHVTIEARDHFNNKKTIGGDYFRGKVYSVASLASQSTDGEIVDHNNGTYSAYFTLRWSGPMYIDVRLIHSSEAIAAMKRVQQMYPVRMAYDGKFQLGDIIHTMRCHIELSSANEICNFTDLRTGEPWFCEKPGDLPCSALMYHQGNLERARIDTSSQFTVEEQLFFKPKTIIGVKGIFVNSTGKTIRFVSIICLSFTDENCLCEESSIPCQPVKNSVKGNEELAAGFYFNDSWYSNQCTLQNIDVFSAVANKCLENKRFYFYGDSTIRQWYEYLVANIPETTSVDITGVNKKAGPLIAHSELHKVKLFYRHHAFPIRNTWMRVEDIKWTANEIDQLGADENVIICINMFAHFVPTSVDVYRSRLLTIKAALVRLYKRSPKTLVFFKSANTREYSGAAGSVNYGDWPAFLLDVEMRKVMSDVPNLTVIDVWDMTNCHRTPEVIHPHPLVIREEIKVLLSLICG